MFDRKVRAENRRLRALCDQSMKAIAFSYGGTHPDSLVEPEDKAMSAAMHALYQAGFGRR